MDSGREAGDQGQGIHLDADRAIPERFLQLDGDQAILGEGDVFLGDGRAKHVFEKVGSADIVLGAGMGVQRESSVLDAQRAHDLGAIGGRQDDGERFAAQLGTRGRQARDSGGGELGQGRLPLGEVIGEEAGFPFVVLDDAAADEVAQEPGADDLQQVRDGGVGDARQGVKHGLAVGASDENSIERDGCADSSEGSNGPSRVSETDGRGGRVQQSVV
jgi:hypothetical protein